MSNFLIYEFAHKSQFAQLQDKLMMVARTSTLMIDADTLLEVPLNRQGINSPQFKVIADKLQEIKKKNPSLKYIYTMAKTGREGILQFIVDPDTEIAEDEPTSFPGDKYDASSYPAMLSAFDGPSVDKRLNVDPWGVFLSGYAPIRDKNGNSVAILGVDMSADDVHRIQKGIYKRAIFVLILGIILSVVVGTSISRKVSKPIKKLVEGTRHIAKGDLEYRVEIPGSDEIAGLGESFNKMALDLKVNIEELKRTTATKERIESELKIAREIQTSMLPRIFPPFPERKEFDIFATMDPAKEVGGDFYDFFLVDKNKLCLIVGDVSGKGVPAALFMAITKVLLKTEALRGLSSDEILSRVNNILYPENQTCMFVTVLCAILDIQTGKIQFSNAGHNPPLIYAGDGSFEFINLPKGFVLGPMENAKFQNSSLALKSNDAVFLYTDGVTEAMNPQDKLFSEQRLQSCLSGLRDNDITGIIHGVRQQIQVFAEGAEQSDDITMLALRYKG